MNLKILYLTLMMAGVVFWNLPDSTSIMVGQHSYYNDSAPCQKCHYDIQNMLDQDQTVYIEHNALTCNGCHAPDGNSSHAARISTCIECHDTEHQTPYPVCNECHDSHGGQYPGISHGNGYSCESCHGTQSPAQHTTTICANCHGENATADLSTAHNDDCDLCHNNPAITLPASANCGNCHGSGSGSGSQTPDSSHHDNTLHEFYSSECVGCHTMIHNTSVPVSGCSKCHDENDLHNVQSLSCDMCHTQHGGSGNFFVESANALSVNDTNCNMCHDNANIIALPTDKKCTSCHGEQLPTPHTNENVLHTTTVCANCHGESGSAVLQAVHNDDCSLCHNNLAITLPASANCGNCHGYGSGSQTPDSGHHDNTLHAFESSECVDCHDMIHTTSAWKGDCSNCHVEKLMEYTHSGQPLECSMCHPLITSHADVTVSTLFVTFDNAASVNDTNCNICHDNANIITLPTDKNCTSCHSEQLPTPHINGS